MNEEIVVQKKWLEALLEYSQQSEKLSLGNKIIKKYITLTQWDQLTREQKNTLWDSGFQRDWRMNIGNMLDFLGDAFECIKVDDKEWVVYNKYYPPAKQPEFRSKVLVDCLWSAVKYKLNKKL